MTLSVLTVLAILFILRLITILNKGLFSITYTTYNRNYPDLYTFDVN